jgi:paraquat-inducible protein B
MAKAANTKIIGLFVLAGIVLAIAAILIFGGGRLFRPAKETVMYFTTSVQGLNVGSPVMFRGVVIGRVTDIDLLYDAVELRFLTRVTANIFPENWRTVDPTARSTQEQFRELVDAGLRAQLIPVSLVTGQLGIGLDLFPGTPLMLFAGSPLAPSDANIPEIPTAPSTIERLETTMQRILAVIDKADFEKLSQDVDQTIGAIRDLFSMPELRDIIVKTSVTVDTANVTMRQVEQMIRNIDQDVRPSLRSLRSAIDSANATMVDARTLVPELKRDLSQVGPLIDKVSGTLTLAQSLIKNLNATVEPSSPLQFELANTMRELTLTLRSVRGLADALEQSPNSILFGKVSGGQK